MRGSRTVLHDISLEVRAGERVAILGPNGCGKSTLIKTMTCELYPLVQPGMRVRIFGRERWDVTELRRRLGVVAAEPPAQAALATCGLDAVITGYFSSATLWSNLHVTDEMREHAAEVLRQVGADALAQIPLGEMSAGQQRRVMIGRALAASGTGSESRMLLLDEPSNALDLRAQHELRDTMRLLAQAGTGIILITHHTADIVPEIDRVLMMRDGRIVADGARGDLLTGNRLSELFRVPVSLTERDGYLHAW